MTRHMFLPLFLAVTIIIGTGGGQLTTSPLQTLLQTQADRYSVSAVSTVVLLDDKTILAADSGSSATSSGESIENRDLYGIGSVSKSFVSVLALMLQEQGLIDLDESVGEVLPNFPFWNRSRITLRDILSMRSGIADYTASFQSQDYFKEYSIDQLINLGLKDSAMLMQGDFHYSNTNILIARAMIEQKTGKSCEALIRELILNPLKLNNIFFASEKAKIRDRLISGYSDFPDEETADFTDTTTSWSDLACGMYSTADDMAVWAQNLISGDFLSDASRHELFDFLQAGGGVEYGLCVAREMIRDEPVMILQGHVPGYDTTLMMRGNLVCAVLCNRSDYRNRWNDYSKNIADELLKMIEQKQRENVQDGM